MSTPKIQPIHIKEYAVKQSTYDVVGTLPIRSIILGPSGSGNTVLLQNMTLDIYKRCFNRVYIFSPSINVDASWLPMKKYIENEIGVKHTDDDSICFDHYDPESLHEILDTQHKITDYTKKKNFKRLFQILIIIDDFADSPEFTRQSKMLHSLYGRGRHHMISTITATQKFNAIHPIIRVNATELYLYKLRNMKDLDTVIGEVSAVLDKKTLLEHYHQATAEPYSFLNVKLTAKDPNEMFYQSYTSRLMIKEIDISYL